MKLPAWLTGILFTAWTIWSTYNYYCNKCGCCSAAIPTPAIPSLSDNLSGEPRFRWDSSTPETGSLFSAWKTKTLLGAGQGDTLVITGFYRKDEKNTSSFENLGLARAHALQALFVPEVPESRIKLLGKLVEDDMNRTDPHVSADFSWSKMMLSKNDGAIIESGSSITILFPYNSTVHDRDEKVENYLKNLCEKHKSDNTKFSIVGHTDSDGDEKRNEQLGLGRAQAIRQVLRNCGIARERIETASKGELEPVADNSTDAGKQQNRRVVITVTQ